MSYCFINGRFFRSIVLLALFSLLGCDSGPKMYSIHGAVTYQGQAVTDGEIIFADAADSGASASAPIENGEYAIRTTAGAKTVRITATQETGKTIEGAMGASYPERIDLIPSQYNTATTLTATVGPDGTGVIDYRLD